MKKIMIALLALAMPIFAQAQIDVITYNPYHNGPYNVMMHGHVNNIDDLAVYDSVEVKCYYRVAGAGSFLETETLIATRDHGTHFEIPAFGLIVGADYECQFSASINDGPEMLGAVMEFTMFAMAASVPETETYHAEHIGNTTATLVGYVDDFASYATAEGFFRYGENPASLDLVTPTVHVADPFGQFEIDVKGLPSGKIINFQACATNLSGESCGDVIHFLTPNKGNVDVEDLSVYQDDDCELNFDFGVDLGGRPLPAPATFKIGNTDGGAVYTKEFWYQGFGSDGLTFTNAMLVEMGIDPYDPVIISLVVSSYGEIGKTSGTVMINNYDCDEFAGEGDDLRLAGNDISIYPNPAATTISVRNAGDNATFYIADLRGKIFGQYTLDIGTTDISVDNLPAGMYIGVYGSDGARITKKFIVE